MNDILKNILKAKEIEIAQAKAGVPLERLREQIENLPKCRNFYQAMIQPVARGIHVIAEIKRSSPSAGAIRPDLDPVEVAEIYQAAGADAISVLTDGRFFGGSLDDLRRVKQVVSLPILRKDFIIDPYQVYEARAAGADAILLIAEALKPGVIMDLLILANSLTLTVLLEVHEMESLLQLKSMVGFPLKNYSLLGINNRNLKTMDVDLNHSLRLGGLVDDKKILVSESGIKTRADVEKLIQAGFGGVLIGETLMRSGDIGAKYKELFGRRESKN
jgi:indole-3-glycerol phosphate synthase